jgi:hypothetical protein
VDRRRSMSGAQCERILKAPARRREALGTRGGHPAVVSSVPPRGGVARAEAADGALGRTKVRGS